MKYTLMTSDSELVTITSLMTWPCDLLYTISIIFWDIWPHTLRTETVKLASKQSLLHTWNTLWWLQIQRTFTSCVQFLALPLCLFGHESCVDLSFALDHLTVCSVTNYAPCVVNFQRWLFVSVDRAIIKCVFLIAFRCCNILSQIKLVHTSWCLAVEIIGVWHESYPSSATVSSLSHVMRLHSYWMS